MSATKDHKLRLKHSMKHRNPKVLKKLALAITITIFAAVIYTMAVPHTYEAHQTQKLQKTYIQLEQTRENLLNTKTNDSKQQQTQNKQIQQLNQQLQDTQKQLEAKKSGGEPVAYAASLPTSYHSDNWYMDYIFQHESSNNPQSVNSIGACGLGQSLPCSKMSNTCGWPASVDCQVSWFTNYATQRYGSWQNAYYYWINHGNW